MTAKMLKETKIKTNRHPEHSEGSFERFFGRCPQNDVVMQQGRSMVEMLGVLAVIGVLSVAGIAGYNSAMNRHRANEILNEASKRAAIVAMQAAAGRSNLTIAEFDNNAALGFTGVNENPNNASQFQLTLSDVDEKVCAQMKNAVGTNTPVRGITSDCGAITYNKDLSTTPYANDFATEDECQSPFKWCSGAETPHCADDCCAGFVESDCQTACDSDTGEVTNAGPETTCDYTTEGAADGVCDGNGACEAAPTCDLSASECLNGALVEGECACAPAADNTPCTSWTNNECGKGKYCNFESATYTQDSNGFFTSVGPGKCATITGVDTPNETNMAILTAAGFKNTFVTSGSTTMRWWSAASWCVGQGKHLIGVDEMGCYRSGTEDPIEAGETWGYCCVGNNGTCGDSDWSNAATNGKFSAKITALKRVYGTSTYFWTASPYGNTSQNSQTAFTVDLYSGGVVNYSPPERRYGATVVCE